jgi:hypothetical protein
VIIKASEPPIKGRDTSTERVKSLDRSSIARANPMRFWIKVEGRVRYADVIGTIALLLTILGFVV